MRKITSLLVLLILAFVGAGSAMADVVAGKVYTIRPYSASTQYVVPSNNWSTLTGVDKATYSTEGAKWLIKTSDDSNGVTISLASEWPEPTVNYLNPWGAGDATSGAIGAWKTNNGDDRWIIAPVAGKDGVYTVKNVSTPAVYLFYNSGSDLLYYNKPGTPAETNYFYFDEVNDVDFNYTLNVVGKEDVTVSYNGQPISASFTTHELVDPEKVTATDVAGYAYSVAVNGTTVTVTYVEKVVDTSKLYYIKNVDADKYVVINASGNATISATSKTLVSIAEMAGGFSIKDVKSDNYLGASGWNAQTSSTAFAWTIAKTSEGYYTFNQQTTQYKGFIGLDSTDDGVKLYCNKGASNHYMFALEEGTLEPEPEPEAGLVTKLSDIVSTKLYTITSVNRGSFVYNETYASDKISASIRSSYTFSETDPNCQFAFVTEGDKTYLWSKGANKFAVYADPNVATSSLVPEQGLTLLASTGGAKATHPVVIAIDGSHQINMSTQEHQGVLTTWNDTGDDGNMLRILPVGDLTTEDLAKIDELLHPTNLVNITYEYSIDGHVFDHETLVGTIGEEFPAPTKSFAGYTLSAKPAGNVSVEGTHTITLGAFNGPFVPTTLNGDDFAEGTKWYYMQNGDNNANGYVVYMGGTEKKSVMTSSAGTSDAYKWAFVRKDGTPYFYLYNKAAGTETMGEQLSDNAGHAAIHNQGFVVAGANDMPLELFANNAGYGFRLAGAEGTCVLGKHVGTNLSIWGNSANKGDNGSRFTFTEAPAEDLGIAYTVKVLGADLKVTVKGVEYENGATTAQLKDLADTDVTLATDDNYVGSFVIEGNNIVATYHHKGAAIDFAGKKVSVGEKATAIVPDTKWYVLTQLRNGETPTWVNAENKVMRASQTAADLFPGYATDLASYLVRFVSTNVDGVYEIQHGNGMYWNTVGANNRKLTASDNVAEAKFYFVYGATQESGNTPGWAMNYTTDFVTKADKVDNDGKGNTVGYWAIGNTTSGTNNVWFLYETTIEVPTTPDWEGLYDAITDTYQYQLGDELGQYTYMIFDTPSNEVFESTMSYYEDLLDAQEATVDEVESAITTIRGIIANLQINQPKKGQLLRIKSSSNWMSEPTYLAGEKASNDHLKFVQNRDINAEAEDNTIWIYDGQYLINYANGLTFATTAAQYGHATLAMYPNTTAVSFQAAQNGTVGKYNVKFAGNRFMYTQNNNLPNLYTDAGSAANSEGYNFELEDATTYFFLDFGTNGWASGYFPIPVAANPEYGIDAAYYIKNDPENDCFQAEPVGGQGWGLIAPFTPVIIKVNAEINGGRPLVKGAPDFSMQPEESALSGALWKQEKPANCLVFNVVDGNPGFYGYNGTTLKHMKAYYEPSAPAASALRINFGEDDTLTGIIEAIEKAEFSGNVFDLQGRRINGVQKGVFVKDGKKVVK